MPRKLLQFSIILMKKELVMVIVHKPIKNASLVYDRKFWTP